MAWNVEKFDPTRLGMRASYYSTWILSNTGLTATTTDLAAQIGQLANTNQRWAVIGFVANAAGAGNATFNSGRPAAHTITLLGGEVQRKPENSPFWFAKLGDGLSLVTDVTLNDVQITVGLM